MIFIFSGSSAVDKVPTQNKYMVYVCRPLLLSLGNRMTSSNIRDAELFADWTGSEIVVRGRFFPEQQKQQED